MIRPTVTDKGQVPLPTTRTWTRLDPTLSTAARATPDSRSRHSSQTGRRDVRSKIPEARTTTSPQRKRNRRQTETPLGSQAEKTHHQSTQKLSKKRQWPPGPSTQNSKRTDEQSPEHQHQTRFS